MSSEIAAKAEVIFGIPIIWEKEGKSASVQAEINGISTKLIIDTGSYPTTFSEQFVQKLGLKYPRSTHLSIVEQPIKIKTGNLTVNIPLFGVIPTADSPLRKNEFATGEYGGVLNPFILNMGSRDRIMIIDFPRQQFYGVEGNKEAREKHFRKYYKNYSLRLEVPYVSIPYEDRILEGNVEGKNVGKVIFDTGSSSTSFTSQYMRGEKVAKQSKSMNIKGEIGVVSKSFPKKIYLSGQLLGEVPISMDAFEAVVNNNPSLTKEYIGAIGLDILQHCAIVIEDTSDKMALFCQTPAREKSVPK